MRRGPGPLWRRAPLRLLGSGTWGLLVLLAFVLLATAAAFVPIFVSGSEAAALATTLDSVPSNASSGDAAVVRLNGGLAPSEPRQQQLIAELAAVPGVSRPIVTGASFANELQGLSGYATSLVIANGHTALARLFGQDDLAASLVPAPGSPQVAAAGEGVWLPQPVAARLGVRPGDSLVLGLDTPGTRARTKARLAGVYEVASDGRRPLDPPGDHRWTQRRGVLPPDTVLGVIGAYLVVADVPTAARLADAVGETLLWSAESVLQPARPSIDSAEQTAAAVDALGLRVLDTSVVDISNGALRPSVVSGIPDLVQHARSIADATVSRTRTAAWAGELLGLAAVAAVALLSAARRRGELALSAGSGLRPASVAGLGMLEVLPAAVAAVVLGTGTATIAMATLSPAGRPPGSAALRGLADASVAVFAGLLLLALVTGVAATVAGRPASARVGRRLPWEALLAVAALTAALGLLGRQGSRAAAGPLDLLVPLLVAAAVGAVGSRLLLQVLPRMLARRRPTAQPPRAPRRPALWLAARRVSVLGNERLLIVTVLTAGIGMLLYAVAGAASVAAVTDDRVAVLSGAAATAEVPASWQLDPTAPALLTQKEKAAGAPQPQAHDLRLPAGDTVLWRRTVTLPGRNGSAALLVIDPPSFAGAASWGTGPELSRARDLLPGLEAAGQDVVRRVDAGDVGVQVPVLVIRPTTLRPGDVASIEGAGWVVPIKVQAVIDTFPGSPGTPGTLVAPSVGLFHELAAKDPRLRPAPDIPPDSPEFTVLVWSAAGTEGIDALTAPAEVTPKNVVTADQARNRPELVAARWGLGYLGALGGCFALLAVIALALYADRAAERARPAEVMLARVGMGRRGPRRARIIDLTLMVLAAFALAVCALLVVARLGPLGLDPGGGLAPAFVLRLHAGAVAAAAAATVVALLAAGSVAWARSQGASEGTVLRDAE